jgi:hypothetical protein
MLRLQHYQGAAVEETPHWQQPAGLNLVDGPVEHVQRCKTIGYLLGQRAAKALLRLCDLAGWLFPETGNRSSSISWSARDSQPLKRQESGESA